MEALGRKITRYGIALLVIVLVGAFLRVYHLGTQDLWLDETFSVWISKLSLSQIVPNTAVDVHPPLYYFLLHYWMSLFGRSESAVRLLSALCGILAIPAIYLVGRQLFDEEAGLLGALILALSSFNIYYSQEARMYSLMVLLTLASMYFFLRFLQRGNLTLSVGYVISTALLLYTHVFGLFVLIAQNIYLVTLLFLSRNHTFRLRHWVGLQAIVLALFAPWVTVLIKRTTGLESGGFWIAPPTIGTIIQTFTTYSGTTLLLVLFLALSVFSLFAYRKVRGSMDWKAPLKAFESYSWEVRIQDATPVYFLAVWLLTINVIPFVISRFSTPIYYDKYTIAASVALYLLVAKGIRNINCKYAKLAVIGIIVILSAANLQTYYGSITKAQGREALNVVNGNATSGDVVVITPQYFWQVWQYYGRGNPDVKLFPASPAGNDTDHIQELQRDVNGHERVWLVVGEAWTAPGGAEKLALNALNGSYSIKSFNQFVGYRIYSFEKRD